MVTLLAGILAFRITLPVEAFYHSLPPHSTVVFVGAHSDDEYLVAGALLVELSLRHHHVVVIAITHGSSKGVIGREYNAQAASTRRRDFHMACAAYQAHGCLTWDFPQFAHYTADGSGTWAETPEFILEQWRELGLLQSLEELLHLLQPRIVLTLDPDHGIYGHPEHAAAARAVMETLRGTRVPVYAAENQFRSLGGTLDPGPIDWALPGQSYWAVGHDPGLYPSQTLPRIDLVPAEERFTFLRRLALPTAPNDAAKAPDR